MGKEWAEAGLLNPSQTRVTQKCDQIHNIDCYEIGRT
jgi:hypothetical protein